MPTRMGIIGELNRLQKALVCQLGAAIWTVDVIRKIALGEFSYAVDRYRLPVCGCKPKILFRIENLRSVQPVW